MAPEALDPYYQWLGIPPKDQPPDHYRLLGIERFESNLEVIQNAADRQMSHVRTFQSGAHVAQSQQLLNELAAAKLCLLNAGQKAAYDASLRAACVKTSAAKSEESLGSEVPDMELADRPAISVDNTYPAGRRTLMPRAAVFWVGVVGVPVVALFCYFHFEKSSFLRPSSPNTTDKPRSSVARNASTPVSQLPPAHFSATTTPPPARTNGQSDTSDQGVAQEEDAPLLQAIT